MKSFGLIGYPIEHSFSKNYFDKKFYSENLKEIEYINIEVQNLKDFFNSDILSKLNGFNVTIPFKKEIIPYLDKVDEAAKTIGAVNCVKQENGKFIGYNTDYIGFYKSLKPLLTSNHKRALILGNGGATKAIVYSLNRLNIKSQIVSRGTTFDYNHVDKKCINEHKIIINCTPLGTHPNIDTYPQIPYNYLTERHLLYDLVYNPENSQFIRFGNEHNCLTKNGLEMLEIQANKSWDIWNGKIYTN